MEFGYDLSHTDTVRFSPGTEVLERHFRWNFLCGSFTLRVGSCDFSRQWGWVPILGFVRGLTVITRRLMTESDEEFFMFTENEQRIVLRRDGANVQVTATYAPCSATVSFEEWQQTLASFTRNVTLDVRRLYPLVAASAAFVELEEMLVPS